MFLCGRHMKGCPETVTSRRYLQQETCTTCTQVSSFFLTKSLSDHELVLFAASWTMLDSVLFRPVDIFETNSRLREREWSVKKHIWLRLLDIFHFFSHLPKRLQTKRENITDGAHTSAHVNAPCLHSYCSEEGGEGARERKQEMEGESER